MEQEPNPTPPLSEAAPQPAMSLPARLLNVFADPAAVFEEVRQSGPTVPNWLVPAILYVLAGWAAACIIFSQETIRHQLTDITTQAIEKQSSLYDQHSKSI